MCVCVWMCLNSLLLNPSNSLSFLTPQLFQAAVCVCVCVCHTHWFPRRQVSKWGGVQTHTEHKQFERVVIHIGVCSQTSRTLFVLQLCFVEKKEFSVSFSVLTPPCPPSLFSMCLSFFHSHVRPSRITWIKDKLDVTYSSLTWRHQKP